MLTIGEFSILTHVPAKTLRYYDEIGLFKPARVDQFTQYRYYSMEQLPRLYRLLAFKGLGLSLEQIAQLLDENLPPEQIRGMLRLKQAEVQQHIAAEQQRLLEVEAHLRQIESEGTMSQYEVLLKNVEPQRVAYVEGIAPGMSQLGPTLDRLFDTVIAHFKQQSSPFTGPPIAVYLENEMPEGDIRVEAAICCVGELKEGAEVKVHTLPAQSMASVVHHGPLATLNEAYDGLLRWIDTNNYQITGSNREVYLQYERNGDPTTNVTELQVPVAKRTT